MPLDAQTAELKDRYKERQLTALRAKYTDEMIYTLCKRWDKPLLKPGTFTRDPKTGKVTGGEPQAIDEEGYETKGFQLREIERIETFQQFLTTRFKRVEKLLNPEIEKIDDTIDWDMKRNLYQTAWQVAAKDIFSQTLKDLRDHGLENYTKLSVYEIQLLKHARQSRVIPIDLRGAECLYATFCGADLTGAHFEGAFCFSAYFIGAMCDKAHFEGSFCKSAYFEGADCTLSHFDGMYSRYTNFTCSVCDFTHFTFADCKNARFDNANCRSAHFDGAICQEAHFDGANCENAQFLGAYCFNAHFNGANCISAYLGEGDFSFASFGTIEIIKGGIIEMEICRLDFVSFDKKSRFIGVDTTEVDWSKNPRLKRFIEQQQYVHAAKEGIDATFGKRKITKPVGWGIKKLISLIDYLSDPLNWVMYAVATILLFAVIHSFCFDAIKFANDVNWFTPIYYSVVTFSTLGFGDIAPLTWYSQLCAVIEVVLGYVFLGGLVTFLANWLGRR